MAGQAISVVFAGKHAKGESHLLKEPLPLRGKCGVLGDAGETFSLGQELERRLLSLLNLISLRGRRHDCCLDLGRWRYVSEIWT